MECLEAIQGKRFLDRNAPGISPGGQGAQVFK